MGGYYFKTKLLLSYLFQRMSKPLRQVSLIYKIQELFAVYQISEISFLLATVIVIDQHQSKVNVIGGNAAQGKLIG